MVLPEGRNQFKSRKQKKSFSPRILLFVGIAAVAAILIWQWSNIMALFAAEPQPMERISSLWNEQRYEEINEICENILEEKPLEVQALLYNGFSYFYRGVNQFSFEEKIVYFDRSIANLRKAEVLEIGEMRGRTLYVLGKSYYYKGKYYADLTIEYLEEAEKQGYVGEDTYEYLGLAYTMLGNYEKSAGSFLKAVAQAPTDTRYLALAQAYFNQGYIDRSA